MLHVDHEDYPRRKEYNQKMVYRKLKLFGPVVLGLIIMVISIIIVVKIYQSLRDKINARNLPKPSDP